MGTKTQQFQDLAALLDNLTNLVKDWLLVVTNPIPSKEQTQLEEYITNFRAIKIPFSESSKPKEEPRVDPFEDELAALHNLELPSFGNLEDQLNALKDLENTWSIEITPASQPEPAKQDDLASLTLPKNFDDFFLPEPKKTDTKRKTRGRMKKFAGSESAFDMNFFAAIAGTPPTPPMQHTASSDDCFSLSSLDQLAASLGSNLSMSLDAVNPPATASPKAPKMSYDDFFAGLNRASETNAATTELAPRGDRLLRSFATKEDMNRRGMQRAKKKSNVDAKGQGIYQMEDAYYSAYPFANNEDLGLFCVFDGHVDKNASQAAAILFPEELEKHIALQGLSDDCSAILRDAFLSTDARMKQFDVEGTTATAVLVWRVNGVRYVQSANVGDSTAFLCRDGTSIMLSKDHKVNEASERQRLLDAGLDLNKGQNRINGLAVSRALGDHFIKDNFAGVTAEPFLSKVYELNDSDSLLVVASDGLWDTMSGQEAMDHVKKIKEPQSIANNLVSMATSSGLCNDNITVTAVLL